jgi:hypothetical protein
MAQNKWWFYRQASGADSIAEKELNELAGTALGPVKSALRSVAKSPNPRLRECPQQAAVRCFSVPTESANVQVLWALVQRRHTLVLLHVATGKEPCPPPAAYTLARARLNDVPT